MILVAVLTSMALLVVFMPIWLARPKPGITPLLVLLSTVFFILSVSSIPYAKSDDEYITFRVVDNFVNGRGFFYNPGERYEAITNIGWSIILSILPFSGLSLEFGSRWLSLAAGIFCIWGVSRLAANLGGQRAGILAPILILFTPFLHYWSSSGLETMAYCALCTWTLAMAASARRFPIYAVLAGISSWLRPETPLIFIAAFLLSFLTLPKNERKFASFVSLLIFAIFFSSLCLFRYLNYETIFAPTASSKISYDTSNISGGLCAVVKAVITSPILFLGFFLALPLLYSKKTLVLFVLSLAGIGYYIWLGQDTMMHERLLAPFIPGLIALLATGLASWRITSRENLNTHLKRISVSLVAGFLIFNPFYLALGSARTINWGLAHAHRQLADYLITHGKAGDSVAVQDAGIIGYFWHGKIIDLSGIFDPSIISIHKAYGRVSNNAQELPPAQLVEMNRQVADYILERAKPQYLVLVYSPAESNKLVPSGHNHNLEQDTRFISKYSHLKNYYYSTNYILGLYELKSTLYQTASE